MSGAPAGRPVYQRKINPTQQVLDQYRSGGTSNARNSRRLNNVMNGQPYGQQSRGSQDVHAASILSAQARLNNSAEVNDPHETSTTSKRAYQYNSQLPAARYDEVSHPLSHSSQMDSQNSKPIAIINYKESMLPEGIEMYKQKQAKKETQQELAQMQNRIRLLQVQEDKMKRRNE